MWLDSSPIISADSDLERHDSEVKEKRTQIKTVERQDLHELFSYVIDTLLNT